MASGETIRSYILKVIKANGLIMVANSDGSECLYFKYVQNAGDFFHEHHDHLWLGNLTFFRDHLEFSRDTPSFTDCDTNALYADPQCLEKLLLALSDSTDYAEMIFKSTGCREAHV